MATSDYLYGTLDDLMSSDLKKFKMFLSQKILESCEPIPRGQLEGCDAADVVSKMQQAYGDEGSLKITLTILKMMNLNNLANKQSIPSMMGNSVVLLLNTLEELMNVELKRFKLYLSHEPFEGFTTIPQGKLETSDSIDVASKVMQAYGEEGAVVITLTILRKMNLNNLADKLERFHAIKTQVFFSENKKTLEIRLPNISSILPQLMQRGVLSQQEVNSILLTAVQKKGVAAQEEFYKILKEVDPILFKDLKG